LSILSTDKDCGRLQVDYIDPLVKKVDDIGTEALG
jgi:hypothetical protein